MVGVAVVFVVTEAVGDNVGGSDATEGGLDRTDDGATDGLVEGLGLVGLDDG